MTVKAGEVNFNKAPKKAVDQKRAEDFINRNKPDTAGMVPMDKVVSVKFPGEMLDRIDRMARKSSINRTSWIRMQLAGVLDKLEEGQE